MTEEWRKIFSGIIRGSDLGKYTTKVALRSGHSLSSAVLDNDSNGFHPAVRIMQQLHFLFFDPQFFDFTGQSISAVTQ
jgi:hypothetical protein